MSNPQTAVQLYALKDPWAADRGATLARISEIGIAGVEAFGIGDTVLDRAERNAQAVQLWEMVHANGLEVVAAHTNMPALDDAGWMFEEVGHLGAPVAIASTTERILGFTRDALAFRERTARLADRLNGLAEIGAKQGIRIGYHTHWWEWTLDDGGVPGFDRFVSLLDPRIALEIDLFWAYAAEQDVADVVAKYVNRVEFLHIKDGDGVRGAPQVAAGTGDVPLEDALEAGTNVRWAVLEVDTVGDADVWQVIADGAAWLSGR